MDESQKVAEIYSPKHPRLRAGDLIRISPDTSVYLISNVGYGTVAAVSLDLGSSRWRDPVKVKDSSRLSHEDVLGLLGESWHRWYRVGTLGVDSDVILPDYDE